MLTDAERDAMRIVKPEVRGDKRVVDSPVLTGKPEAIGHRACVVTRLESGTEREEGSGREFASDQDAARPESGEPVICTEQDLWDAIGGAQANFAGQ